MCKKTHQSRYRKRGFFPLDAAGAASQACARCVSPKQAFFSFDAAFAIVLCVAAFAGFSLLLSSAASSTSASASSQSSSLLALRFSSFVLSESQAQGPIFGAGQYYKSYELDLARLGLIDLHAARLQMGRGFASILVAGGSGTAYFASDGEAKGEVYCTKRLALLGGKMVRLEACIS